MVKIEEPIVLLYCEHHCDGGLLNSNGGERASLATMHHHQSRGKAKV